VFFLGENHVAESLINLCLFRLIWLPFTLLGMGISRLVARFDRAKRFVSYALLIEGLTLVIAVALLIHALGGPKNR
jgi:predicted Co/Zn/Cd cation transporter (cation efflux family)